MWREPYWCYAEQFWVPFLQEAAFNLKKYSYLYKWIHYPLSARGRIAIARDRITYFSLSLNILIICTMPVPYQCLWSLVFSHKVLLNTFVSASRLLHYLGDTSLNDHNPGNDEMPMMRSLWKSTWGLLWDWVKSKEGTKRQVEEEMGEASPHCWILRIYCWASNLQWVKGNSI